MTILEEAQKLVHGDRQDDYGHPADDFARTALIWTAVLGHPVTAKQVALCMVGVKISREVHCPKRDNRVDGAGYWATADMIEDRQSEPPTTHTGVVYIAGRFRHPELEGHDRRLAEQAELDDEGAYAAAVIKAGFIPYSPLATSVAAARAGSGDVYGDHWIEHDLRILRALRPIVLMRPGWDAIGLMAPSAGASREFAEAEGLSLDVLLPKDTDSVAELLQKEQHNGSDQPCNRV